MGLQKVVGRDGNVFVPLLGGATVVVVAPAPVEPPLPLLPGPVRSLGSVPACHQDQPLGVFLGQGADHHGDVSGLARCDDLREDGPPPEVCRRAQVAKSRQVLAAVGTGLRCCFRVGAAGCCCLRAAGGMGGGRDPRAAAVRERPVLIVDQAMGDIPGYGVARKGRLSKGLEAGLFQPREGAQDLCHLLPLRRGRSLACNPRSIVDYCVCVAE
mmetsp:Transcript_8412/g.17502  ORF Transcript_8412/g.17502 Transcript_8412/m.17502 type:complete len:213 (-) Transcript_8412:1-639(-)